MTYVITQNCCKGASCVPVCPVECIRPIGGALGAPTDTEMLYIEPNVCIDCGACEDQLLRRHRGDAGRSPELKSVG